MKDFERTSDGGLKLSQKAAGILIHIMVQTEYAVNGPISFKMPGDDDILKLRQMVFDSGIELECLT